MNPFPIDLLLLSIATPLAAALIIALGARKKLATLLAGIGFTAPALVAVFLVANFAGAPQHHGYAFFTSYDTGLASWGIKLTLGLNGISLGLFALAGIVGLAAGLYAIQSGAERLKHYLMLLLVMQGGLMGVFASVDIFFFYFFHEFALIATFIMVGVWGGRDRNYAAMMMTIYLTLGAMLSLAGLIAIHIKSGAGTFDLITLRETIAAQPLSALAQKNIFGILMFGFGVLVSLFPLHSWAPLGYGAAPSSAAMLHAGVLKKFGLYGLIQIALPLIPSGAAHWSHTLALLALGNVIIIGFVTIAQSDLKQMIGYSSVMHMGYAFLGVATASTLGAGGVVLLMIAHGLSVALLFLLVTSIHHRTQTFDMNEMGGLAKQAPVLAALFVAATFASIGLPGFANFWGELLIFVALWKYSQWMTIAAVAGIIISAIYGLRSASRVFFGPPTEAFAKIAAARPPCDLRWGEKIPALVLLAALVLIGVWPKIVSGPIDAQIKSSTGFQPVGLESGTGSLPVGLESGTGSLPVSGSSSMGVPPMCLESNTGFQPVSLKTAAQSTGGSVHLSDEGRRFNANGVVPSSLGLATQLPTLGDDEKNTQPQWGCVLCCDPRDTTPLGLMIYMTPIPKVALADSGNLGLEDTTPLGFFPRRLTDTGESPVPLESGTWASRPCHSNHTGESPVPHKPRKPPKPTGWQPVPLRLVPLNPVPPLNNFHL